MTRDTVATRSGDPGREKSAWFEGVVGSYMAGLAGAVIYAAACVYTDLTSRVTGFLAILIGLMVGFALTLVGKVSGTIAGIVGGIIALVCWILSLEIAEAWLLAQESGGSFLIAIGDVMPRSLDLVTDYFQADAMGYLFVALAISCGYVAASGVRWKR